MRFLSLSLKYKFIITIVCFTVLLAVSFGFIVTDRLSKELWKQFHANGQDLVKTLASKIDEKQNTGIDEMNNSQELSVAEVFEQTEILQETLKLLKEYLFQEEIMYFQLVDDGLEYNENPGKVDPGILLIEPVLEVYQMQEITLQDGSQIIDFKQALPCGVSLEHTGPTQAEVELCGGPSYVRVGLSPLRVIQELRQAVLLFTLVSATFILVGVLVAFILYKWVLGPVEVLTASVKQFRHDRYARAHVHSGDELEVLADEFNKMASTIAKHEHHLEHINRELYKANQVKSEFLAVMGHELKTPLHAISGFSQLLLQGVDGDLSEDQAQDIESILSSGNHLLELIDNILRFSKLEAGVDPLQIERIYADQIVGEALRSVESLARHSHLTLIDETSPVVVEADATKLKQILINLLSNAIKYAPNGTITVRAFRVEDTVQFAVADTGPGIDPRNADKVFEPFTQLDGSTTRESSGIGLGLAIVKKYIEMHGGRVWFEPNPQGGTIFYFSLPASQPLTQTNSAFNGHRQAISAAFEHKEEQSPL